MNKKTISKRFLSIIVVAILSVAFVIPGVAVAAPDASATRTLPVPASVDPGADFDVGIEASGAGVFGQVVETLPAGFSYVDTDSTDVTVTEDGDTVRFTFMGDAVTFDYEVTASTTAGSYSFSGIVKDEDLNESTVGGDTGITVASAGAASASRTLPDSVAPGADFDVGIEASGAGVFGQVVETLPAGFSYVGTDSTDVIVTEDGSTVEFTFMGDGVTFDYEVTASTTEGTYSFYGIVKDEDLNPSPIAGDDLIEVVPPDGGIVELEFDGTLARNETSDVLTTIPAGATELEITLSATADLDLNLYDSDTFVIGWHGEIDSAFETTGTYEGDTFAYSGWDDGEEYINSDGPLGRAYDLNVYGYEAGGYTVTVSYVLGAPPNPPPTISITVPATVVLGNPVTVTVSATDADGVRLIWFGVWPEEYPEEWGDEEGPMAMLGTFTSVGSLTFTPGWAGTYTVEAFAYDLLGNGTPEAIPEIDTFVVSE